MIHRIRRAGWLLLTATLRDQRDIVIGAIVKELGIHLSANHPSGKDHFGYSYDMVKSIEVWNSAIWSKNANAIMIWDDMLSSGRKLTGRGGSDAHHGKPPQGKSLSSNSPIHPSPSVAPITASRSAGRLPPIHRCRNPRC